MREHAIELGEFADYVYRQPSAEGELSADYINKYTSYPPDVDAIAECFRIMLIYSSLTLCTIDRGCHVMAADTGLPLPALVERVSSRPASSIPNRATLMRFMAASIASSPTAGGRCGSQPKASRPRPGPCRWLHGRL